MRQLCQNFIKNEIVLDLGSINIKYPHNFLEIKKVYLRNECVCDAVHKVRLKCLNFYVTSTIEIKKKLPLNNKVFKDMFFLSLKADQKISVRKAAVFKDWVNVDAREVEWRNLLLTDKDLMTKLCNMSVEERWHDIYLLKTFGDTFDFKQIATLAKYVLTMPHSNAESERIFSMATHIKNKKRNPIAFETPNSMCVVRSVLQSYDIRCYE